MAGEIEFLEPEPSAGDNEPRHTFDGGRTPRADRRVRLFGVVAAGVVILGVLIARAVTGGGSSPVAAPSARPTAASSPRPSVASIAALDPNTGDSSAVPDLATQLCDTSGEEVRVTPASPKPMPSAAAPAKRRADLVTQIPGAGGATVAFTLSPAHVVRFDCIEPPKVARCPRGSNGASSCTSTTHLPAKVQDAIRDEFAGAQVNTSFTEITRKTKTVYFRSVMLTVNPDVTLEITLQQPGSKAGPTRARNYGPLVQDVRAVHRGTHLTSIAEFSGRFGRRTTLAIVSRLAADPRLASVG